MSFKKEDTKALGGIAAKSKGTVSPAFVKPSASAQAILGAGLPPSSAIELHYQALKAKPPLGK